MAENPSYHVFGVAETWLGPVVDDSLIQIDNYILIRKDRNVNGGGVAMYVRRDFTVTELAASSTTGKGNPAVPEYLFCQLQQGGLSLFLVGVVYRPPKIAMQRDSGLFSTLRSLCGDFSQKIIMGDLNADLLLASDDANTIRRLAEELFLQIVHHGPTHHTSTSHTWIDLIMVDDNDAILGKRCGSPPFLSQQALHR